LERFLGGDPLAGIEQLTDLPTDEHPHLRPRDAVRLHRVHTLRDKDGVALAGGLERAGAFMRAGWLLASVVAARSEIARDDRRAVLLR